MNHSSCPKLLTLRIQYKFFKNNLKFSTIIEQNKLLECYKELNLPSNAKQKDIHKAFLELAKKYHPDSGKPEASMERFVAIENAFRILSKHNTGKTCSEEVDAIIYDIQHTAPQHRQYLSYEGVGHGTPYQRQKQWIQVRAQKAANNVMEHRITKSLASDKTLMKKDSFKKHDIKTKYGLDRLVEDYIVESMSKGEFDNLSGSGEPLKDRNNNSYVDFTTHKLNEVLINNGFTPEWITMNKDIDQDIDLLKEEIKKERMRLGPYPLNTEDHQKWVQICENNRLIVESINMKINTFNLIVPLLNKQKFYLQFDKICDDILRKGTYSTGSVVSREVPQHTHIYYYHDKDENILSVFFKALIELFQFDLHKKKEKS